MQGSGGWGGAGRGAEQRLHPPHTRDTHSHKNTGGPPYLAQAGGGDGPLADGREHLAQRPPQAGLDERKGLRAVGPGQCVREEQGGKGPCSPLHPR